MMKCFYIIILGSLFYSSMMLAKEVSSNILYFMPSILSSVRESMKLFYNVDIINNEVAQLEGKQYIILTHSSVTFDYTRVTKEGVENLLRIKDNTDDEISFLALIPTFAIESKMFAKYFYFEGGEVDVIVESTSGQHKINFVNAEKIFIGGGYFSDCLCETIRDVVRGRNFSEYNKVLNLYIVRDATYDWEMVTSNDPYASSPLFSLDNIDASDIKALVEKLWIPNFKCPNQNSYNFPDLDLSMIKMDIYVDGQLLNSYDLEPDDNRKLVDLEYLINVHFIHSSDILNY